MAEFQKGDVVMLKSGGPKMTITAVDPSPVPGASVTRGETAAAHRYRCQWFIGEEKVKDDTFDEESLRKVEEAA